MNGPRTRARALVAAALLAAAAPSALVPRCAAAPLPEAPPPGTRLTVTLGCDFEERYWEVSLYVDTVIPMAVSWRQPGMFGIRPRARRVDLGPDERRSIYAAVREVINGFELGVHPAAAAASVPDRGERTLSITALVLDERLGRLDRVALDLDLVPGRQPPPGVTALIDELSHSDRHLTADLDCR